MEEEHLEAMKGRFEGEIRRNRCFLEDLGGSFFRSQRAKMKKMKWGSCKKGGR